VNKPNRTITYNHEDHEEPEEKNGSQPQKRFVNFVPFVVKFFPALKRIYNHKDTKYTKSLEGFD